MMTESQLKEILEKNPDDLSALRALSALYGREERYAEQADVLRSEVEATGYPSEKAWLTYRRAQIEEERLQDMKSALITYASVQGDEAWERLAFKARERILRLTKDMDGLAGLLAEEPAWANEEDIYALRIELARVLSARLEKTGDAVNILQEILAKKPDDLFSAVALAENLVSSGDWQGLAGIYEALAEIAGSRNDPALESVLSFRLGQIYEARLNNHEKALHWYKKAASDEIPADAGIAIPELMEADGDLQGLKEWLLKLIEQSADTDPVMFQTWSFKLARLESAELNQPEEAAATLKRLIEKRPEDINALFALEKILEAQGPSEELVGTGARISEFLDELPLKFQCLWSLAGKALYDMQDAEKAMEFAQKAREIYPDHIGALKFMQYLYYLKRDWTSLDNLLKEEIEKTQDPRELQGLYFWRAEVAGYGLKDTDLALDCFRQTLEIPPSQLPGLKGLERLYREKQDWENLVKVITALARLLTEKEYKAYYSLLIAELYERKLNRDDLAFNSYSEVLKSAPENPEALLGLARICRRQKAWKNLLAVDQRLFDLFQDSKVRALILLEMADVYEKELKKPDKTAEIYTSLAELMPESAFAYEELRRLSFGKKKSEDYIARLRDIEEKAASQEIKAAFMLRRGLAHEVLTEEIKAAGEAYGNALDILGNLIVLLPSLEAAQMSGDWEKYVSLLQEYSSRFHALFESALAWQAAHVMAEKLLSTPATMLPPLSKAHDLSPGNDAVARPLERVLRAEHNYSILTELLEKGIAGRQGAAALESRLERAEILARKHADEESAINEYLAVLKEAPERPDVIRMLEDIYERTENWTELIRIILKEVALRKDASLLISLYLRLAGLYEEKFSAMDQAIKAYQAVIKIKPDHLESVRNLARLFEKTENWEELVKTLQMESGLIKDVPGKISLYSRAAQLCDEKIGQVDRALELLKSALELDPSNTDTLGTLERVYEREGRHRELIDVLSRQIELNKDTEVLARLHTRVAVLWEEKLGDDSRAIEGYINVREIKPRDESALNALERLFERTARWEELIDTLERLAEIAGDPAGRTELYLRIGALWEEKLDKPEPAIVSLRRVIEADPRQVDALEALDRLYEKTGNYTALVEVLLSLAEAVSGDVPRAVKLFIRVGGIQEKNFSNDPQALAAYGEAMKIDPGCLDPIRLARAIQERNNEWAEVMELWDKEEPLVEDPELKKEIFFKTGDILDNKLGKRDEAGLRYEKALEIDGVYLPAVKPLAEIYFEAEAWDKAGPLYKIWSEHAGEESADKGAEIFYRQGWINEQLDDIENALERYHRSSETKPVYLPPLERLSEIYYKQSNYGQAEPFYERVLELEREKQNTETVFEVLKRLGEIEVKLEKNDAAIGRYEDALTIVPGDYETLRSLIPLYSGKQDWAKLLATYDQCIRNAPGPELISAGLVEKGEVLEEQLNQVESATAHYERAVEVKPDYLPGWERLGGVYVKQKKWQEAVGALEKMIELEEDTEKCVEYNYKVGKIYQESFSDLERARVYFEAALSLNETHVPSIEAIGMIYLRQKEWEKYLDVTHKAVKLIPQEKQEKAIPLYMRMGEVYRDFLENKEKAILEFQNVTRIDPEHEEARSALAALYISDKNFFNNAIRENLILLRQNPFRIQSYRDLGKIYEGLNRLDEVYCVYSVLDVLKSLNAQEKMFFEAHQPQVVKESKRSLNEESHEKVLIHPEERGPLHDVLVLMGDYLEKVFPPDLEKLGAKKSFKVQQDSTAPIKKSIDELANNIGITEYDLYLVPTSTEPKVANTNPPSLIINQDWFSRFRPEERRFILGRWLEHLKSRHALVLNFSPEKVVKTMFLLAKLFKSEIQVPGLSESEAQSEMKTVKRAVPRKIRSQLESAAVGFATEGAKADVEKWLAGIRHTANRSGLLLANNLPASISAAMKTHPKFMKMKFEDLGDPIPILEQNDEVVEMLMFSISDAYFTLRRKIGFSLLSI